MTRKRVNLQIISSHTPPARLCLIRAGVPNVRSCFASLPLDHQSTTSMTIAPAILRRRSQRQATAGTRAFLAEVRRCEPKLRGESGRVLADRADEFRADCFARGFLVSDGERLAQVFALLGEAARRTLGIEFYDCQLLAGAALCRGSIAEMQTGEGNTYVAALPAFVQSLAGRGVHVATSNAYLAERDAQQLRPLFESLNAQVGVIRTDQSPADKRAAYQCDVTYGPGCDFGFDYLRDQLTLRRAGRVAIGDEFLSRLRGTFSSEQGLLQRGLISAVIDEIDNVLIDDAASPLILCEEADRPADDADAHRAACELAGQMSNGTHFNIDRRLSTISLTEAGHDFIWQDSESLPLKCLQRPWTACIEQALRARHFFKRDVQYVVRDGKVVIVDESTGRLFEERTWNDGLHQAVEAREGVQITADKRASARITRQRFYRLYKQLCGMTGTATGNESEFRGVYGLAVTPIPTNRPSQRVLLRDRFFTTLDAKWDAVAAEVRKRHSKGQPVLIGTRSITRSIALAERLEEARVPFQLLNGVQDADEASIIARAGIVGTVTIATNMAGRGTDIQPDADALARGGLHVIGTERHDSSRIDRQLIGRAARQGNPGSAQFFVSAEDELLVRFDEALSESMSRMTAHRGEISSDLSRSVRKVQLRAEKQGLLMRLRVEG
jgi:preprotein translocase subunit SecA